MLYELQYVCNFLPFRNLALIKATKKLATLVPNTVFFPSLDTIIVYTRSVSNLFLRRNLSALEPLRISSKEF